MTLLSFAWKNVSRRRLRSLLAVGGLAMAVAAVVALVGIARGFEESFLELYTRRGCDFVVQARGGVQRLNSGIDARLGERIADLPGVRQVIGGLMDVVAIEGTDLHAVIVNGWAEDCPVLDQVNTVLGRRLLTQDTGKAMLGRVLAANLRKTVGDRIKIYGQDFEIAGVFESFSVYENGAVFVLLEDLQRLTNRRDKVTGYVVQSVHPDTPTELAELRRQLERLAPNLVATPTEEFVGSISQIALAREIAWVVSSIAVVLGGVGMLNTMLMAVTERTREIGTLRALGWRRSRVARAIVLEALLLGVVGAVLGNGLGLAIVYSLGHLPATAGLIEARLSPIVLLHGVTLSLLICALGALYPAYRSARLAPIEVMRQI